LRLENRAQVIGFGSICVAAILVIDMGAIGVAVTVSGCARPIVSGTDAGINMSLSW